VCVLNKYYSNNNDNELYFYTGLQRIFLFKHTSTLHSHLVLWLYLV